jgi:capsular exopolysaccharide synthesis family protein
MPAESTDRPAAEGRSLMTAIVNRWPLIALCLVGMLALGFLGLSRQDPTYESKAQILVIKNRTDQSNPNDYRVTFVEDYVSTQLTVIKSERILLAAARKLIPSQFEPPLPEDEVERYQMIARNLAVVRDRESASTGGTGSSVLNLSMRGANPRDCRIILETIITTYQSELSHVYNTETRKLIKRLEAEIQSRRESRESRANQALKYDKERLAITPENLSAITARLSVTRDRLNTVNLEIIDLNDQLNLIAKAGKNRRDRVATYILLGGQKHSPQTTEQNSPENMLLVLSAQKQELLERLGKDHSTVRNVQAQITYYQKLLEAQNPDDPTGELDELALLEKRLQQRLRTAELQRKELQSLIADDTQVLQTAGPLQTNADQLRANMALDLKEENARQDQLDTLTKSEQGGGFEANVLSTPREGSKVGPSMLTWLGGAFFLGMIAGIGLAYLAETLDRGFQSPAEIRERLGVPIFGHVPRLRKKLPPEVTLTKPLDPSLISVLRPKSIEAEAYRGIRAQLMVASEGKGHQIIQITSPNPGDGKSTLAANLAVSLAQTGKSVILLDCDFRKPRVHKLFQLEKSEIGLASVTHGQAALDQAIRSQVVERLDILPCGPRPENPAELLTSLKFQEVLSQLRLRYDYVIVDTPPLLAVSDPRVVAQRVDGVLLVFQISPKARPLAERAREQLVDMGANLLGVVVNGSAKQGGEYGYGGNYSYNYDYEYAEDYADRRTSREEESS